MLRSCDIIEMVATVSVSYNLCYVLGDRKTSPPVLTSYASHYDVISHTHSTRLSAKEASDQPLKGKIREQCEHYEDGHGDISSRVPTFVQGCYAVTDCLIFLLFHSQ